MELDMSVIETAADTLPPTEAPALSTYPPAVQDVALVVPAAVAEIDVERALAAGVAETGDVVLESLRLFDIYTGAQIDEGHKSLAYTLRFRAPDRTLTAEEAGAARDAAVAEAARRTGAVLRGAS
jgi:phenylalanyl-tRNA synthetase beta chain